MPHTRRRRVPQVHREVGAVLPVIVCDEVIESRFHRRGQRRPGELQVNPVSRDKQVARDEIRARDSLVEARFNAVDGIEQR
jgi:hypothetical protein